MKQNPFKISLLASVIAGVSAVPAQAADFYFGANDNVAVQVNSELSLGASWRTASANDKYLAAVNGGSGDSGTSDDGNLNFGNGDLFSEILKGSHEISLNAGNFGAFTRFKYWTDNELENGNQDHGNSNTNYAQNQPLSDAGFSDNAKFSGISLLDAYVYGSFDVMDMPLDLRLGRQVVSWGESTFIQGGMNSSNPFDVSALRRPGAMLKEGILPVGMAYMNLGVSESLSVEAFYQYEWAKTEVDGCGTLFAVDFAASGCDHVTIPTGLGSDTDAFAMGLGAYVFRANEDEEAKDGGQYGLAARYFAEELNNTEFGVYFMNIHSRVPLVSGVRNTMPTTVAGTAAVETATTFPPLIPSGAVLENGTPIGAAYSQHNASYFIEFPEDLKYYGLSFATNLGGVAVSGEVSYKPDTPIQINGNHLVGSVAAESLVSPDGNHAVPFAQKFIDAQPGAIVRGYTEFDVTQVQFTALQFIDRVLGASRITFVGEVGMTLVDGIEDDPYVYGRDTIFNFGSQGDDGYVTDMAWGYRALASAEYSDVFAGVSLEPSVFFSHDVEGYSPTPGQSFNEGSMSFGVSLEASYQQTYSASLDYKTFSGGDYNTLQDKDFVSLSVAVSY